MKLKRATLMLMSVIILMMMVHAASAHTANETLESFSDDLDGLNDTIHLPDGVYYEHDITIDKSVRIIGSNDTAFDGMSQSSLFTITDGVQVTFENVRFENFKSQDNGAVFDIKKSAGVILINCTFTNNAMAIDNHGDLRIYNSHFYNNSLTSQNSKGGAISNDGKLYIENTLFTGSYGEKYSRGATIYNNGDLTLNRTTIADAYAAEDSKGSALFNNGRCLMVNSRIENNTVERYDFNYMHGAVYNQANLTAIGNIFKNNTGKYVRPNTWYEGSPTIYNVGDLNLSCNAFIGNVYFKGLSVDVFSNGARHISLDGNWWQSNGNPIEENKINAGNTISNWIVLDVTPEYSALDINGSVVITASWKLSTGEDFDIESFPKFSITLTDGVKTVVGDSFVFDDTSAKGSRTVTASVCNFSTHATVDIGKIPVYISMNAGNVTYPGDVFVDLASNVNQNITLTLNCRKNVIEIKDNRANITFKGLDADTYDLFAVYEGDGDHFKAFNQTKITVAKMQVSLTIANAGDIKTDGEINAKVILEPNVSPVTAQLYINGAFNKTLYLYDAINNLTFRNLKEGRYDIAVTIAERENYFSANATASFNVGRYDPRLSVSVESVRLGENATAIIHSCNFTGDVILSINGVNSTVLLENDTNVTISNLEGGRYTVSVIFNGNSLYMPSASTASFSVIRDDPGFNVTVNETGEILIRTNPDCTGRVGVYVNFDVYYLNITEGRADFRVKFDSGTNYIFAFYEGDRNHENATYNTTLMLDSEFIIVSEDVEAWEYNDFAYSIVLVEENRITMPDRQVSFVFGGKTSNVTTDNDGIASIKLNLACGDYTVSARYLNRTVTNAIKVRPITFTLDASDVAYGQAQSIRAVFEGNITGNVSFQINNINSTVEINNSVASIEISALKIGKYNVKATYFNEFMQKSKNATFNVIKATPRVNVKAANILPGEDETIEVTFLDNITGEVKITVDQEYLVKISDSRAVLKLSNLKIGTYDVVIEYSGSENYTGFTCSTSFAVRNATTNIILEVNNTVYGEIITVNARLNSTATGNVTFEVAGIFKTVKITEGIATCTFENLAGGTYRIDARYSGDMTFAPSSAYAFFRVFKADATLNIATGEIALGENILIYAYLPSDATGEVYFSMVGYYSPRARQIDDGMAFWYISPLEAGRYTVLATYAGDSNYSPVNATFLLKVSQTKTLLSVSVNDASVNDRVMANVELMDVDGEPLTGNISLKINNNVYAVNVENGAGRLVIGKLPAGNYIFQATYAGDDDYSTASASGSFKVAENLLETDLVANNVTSYYKGSQTLEVMLTSNGKPVSMADITVSVNNRRYSLTTGNDGKAALSLDLNPGTYCARITFDETLSHEAAFAASQIRVLSTINATDVVKLYKSGTQYFAMFYTSEGKALANAEVKFYLNGKTYEVKTLPNGVVRLNVNINPGTYKITAINPQTGEKAVNTIRIYAKIMNNKDLTQYYGANKIFKVRIFNASTAKHVGAGQKVKFKINKKTYTARTDKNGYASIKIRLKQGRYTITTSYDGYKVSNKVTVKPLLSAKDIVGKNVRSVKFKVKLVGKNGKALKAKTVKIKFKGKTYKVKTNKKGIAALALRNLKIGKYKIVSSYGKSKITNTIKIR